MLTLAGDVSESVVDSVKAALETVKVDSTASIYEYLTSAYLGYVPFSKSGGGVTDWILEGVCRVVMSKSDSTNLLGLCAGTHDSIPPGKLTGAKFTMSEYFA